MFLALIFDRIMIIITSWTNQENLHVSILALHEHSTNTPTPSLTYFNILCLQCDNSYYCWVSSPSSMLRKPQSHLLFTQHLKKIQIGHFPTIHLLSEESINIAMRNNFQWASNPSSSREKTWEIMNYFYHRQFNNVGNKS